MRMKVILCSFNKLVSSFAMDSRTVALCLLLMGWWSFHVVIRPVMGPDKQCHCSPFLRHSCPNISCSNCLTSALFWAQIIAILFSVFFHCRSSSCLRHSSFYPNSFWAISSLNSFSLASFSLLTRSTSCFAWRLVMTALIWASFLLFN